MRTISRTFQVIAISFSIGKELRSSFKVIVEIIWIMICPLCKFQLRLSVLFPANGNENATFSNSKQLYLKLSALNKGYFLHNLVNRREVSKHVYLTKKKLNTNAIKVVGSLQIFIFVFQIFSQPFIEFR